MHPQAKVDEVLELARKGMNASQVSEATGVPRRTVADWRNGRVPRRAGVQRSRKPTRTAILSDDNHAAYCYVLGLYLGDGDLTVRGSSARLRVSLDSRYPGIVTAASMAIQEVVPEAAVRVRPRAGANMMVVTCYSAAWLALLPQHGTGPKHARDVRLVQWQRELTARHPKEFVRGLVHSDGCRFVARQLTRLGVAYEYPRYCFANRSTHLIDEFCAHLDLLGVSWTMPRPDLVQIARRDGVAALDRFIGAKR